MTCMWGDGVFLGIRGKTGEVIFGEKSGVWKTRTVQWRPVGERWKSECAKLVMGVPWNTRGAAEDEAIAAGGRGRYITKAAISRYGATTGCQA